MPFHQMGTRISIIQAAQRAYYINKDYDKAIAILSKASNYLQLKSDSKYEDIINVNWEQIQITLYEKGATTALPLVQSLMKTIDSYHSKLSTGFTPSENAVNLLLGENVSKNFLFYPNGTQVIRLLTDDFIQIYQNDKAGVQYVRMFKSSKSYIGLLDGDLKSALALSSEIMGQADDIEKCMYAMNYGHALFLNKQGVEKAINQYKIAALLDEETIYKSLLMDFQTLRQHNLDLSLLNDYENQIKTKYLKKYYKKLYIKEIVSGSQAEKVGLKLGDIIELYNNEMVYDIELFCNERRAEHFNPNLKPREIKVLRNGQYLTFTVVSGLIGVYLDYEK
jgi:hypothetical protein